MTVSSRVHMYTLVVYMLAGSIQVSVYAGQFTTYEQCVDAKDHAKLITRWLVDDFKWECRKSPI